MTRCSACVIEVVAQRLQFTDIVAFMFKTQTKFSVCEV